MSGVSLRRHRFLRTLVSSVHSQEPIKEDRLPQIHLLCAVSFTIAGVGWLLVKGPTQVIRGTVPLDIEAPFSYMVMAFPFLGILVADALALWKLATKWASLVLILQVGCICFLSIVRLTYRLPISGHVLLIAFFILYSLGTRRALVRTIETLVAVVAFCVLLATKLIAWSDWQTPAVALAVAVTLWMSGNIGGRALDMVGRRTRDRSGSAG